MLLTREELYQQVWNEPMRVLAKRFGISDVGLAKVCKRLNVPFPKLGHWQKIKFGKKVRQLPLPPIVEGALQKVEITPKEPKRKPEVEPEFAAKVEAAIELEEREENRIVAPEVLESPHKLVTRTLAGFKGDRPDYRGCVSPGRNGAFRAYVSPEIVPRVLRILDALLKGIEKRGHQILVEKPQIDRNGYSHTPAPKIVIFGQALEIHFREGLKQVEKEYTAEEKAYRKKYPELYRRTEKVLRPKGRLELHISGERIQDQIWRDTEKTRLESRLNEIMAGLFEASREKRAADIRHKKWEEERREEENRRWEREKLQREEEVKIKELEGMAAAWRRSQDIQAFLKATREMVVARDGQIYLGEKFDLWLQWAERWAESINPLRIEK